MNKSFLNTRRKKKKDKATALNRLTDLITKIVSLVGCPANGEVFPVVKSLDSEALSTIHVDDLLGHGNEKEPDAESLARDVLVLWSKQKTIER